jgi:hypothetical protein
MAISARKLYQMAILSPQAGFHVYGVIQFDRPWIFVSAAEDGELRVSRTKPFDVSVKRGRLSPSLKIGVALRTRGISRFLQLDSSLVFPVTIRAARGENLICVVNRPVMARQACPVLR